MSGNAPARIWAVIDPALLHEGFADADGVLPAGFLGTMRVESTARLSAQQRDEAFNRHASLRKHLVEAYVLESLAVPEVGEFRKAIYDALMTHGPFPSLAEQATVAGDAAHAVLSRLSGDDDGRPAQRQDSTADQVESVRLLAQKHGCYDAADWIVRMREVDAERHTYPLEVGVQSTTDPDPMGELGSAPYDDGSQPMPGASPSTTETATGHEYSLIDAVLPAVGGRRAWLVRAVANDLAADHDADTANEWDREAEVAYDALREALAAAPATPETESEGNDGDA